MPPTKPRTISPEKAKCCAESRTTIADLIDEWGKENFHDDWYCGSDVEKTLSVFHLGSLGYFIGKKLKEQQQDLLRTLIRELDEEIEKYQEIIDCEIGTTHQKQTAKLAKVRAESTRNFAVKLLGEKGEKR